MSLSGSIRREIRPRARLLLTGGIDVRPDGRYTLVAAVLAGQSPYADLYTISLATGAFRRVATTPNLFERSPQFVSAGRAIVTYQDARVGHANGRVASVDLATGRMRAISPRGQVVGWAAARPRAPRIVYDAAVPGTRRRALWAVPAGGGPPRRVALVDASYPSLFPGGRKALVRTVGAAPIGLVVIRVP